MSKYVKKPVVIEAFQLGVDHIPDWFMNKVSTNEIILKGTSSGFNHCEDTNADINTLEGVMHANFGDYIIKGVNGEIYPCKPDIFEKTYETTPTLEEVKKEWEEKGYKFVQETDWLIKISKDILTLTINNSGKGGYTCNGVLIYAEEHQLLTKTFKALGWKV